MPRVDTYEGVGVLSFRSGPVVAKAIVDEVLCVDHIWIFETVYVWVHLY